jgi:hypothetical protein
MGAVDDASVPDGVDMVKEPVKPVLRHAARDLRPRESQRLELRPCDDTELSSRQPGESYFTARVFCITTRQFAIAHETYGDSRTPDREDV